MKKLLLIALCVVLLGGCKNARDDRIAAYQAKYDACDYIGSRYEPGWHARKVYRYDCDGIIEETTMRPSNYL